MGSHFVVVMDKKKFEILDGRKTSDRGTIQVGFQTYWF